MTLEQLCDLFPSSNGHVTPCPTCYGYRIRMQDGLQLMENALQRPAEPSSFFTLYLYAPSLITPVINAQIEDPASVPDGLLEQSATLLRSMFFAPYPELAERLEALMSSIPDHLLNRMYWSKADDHTYTGSNNRVVANLAKRLQTTYTPDLIVATAHGSIRPASVLAHLLDAQLYFVRFSSFRYDDKEPKMGDRDWNYLRREGEGNRILIFDEDAMSGNTLQKLSQTLEPLEAEIRTAATVRHQLSSFRPDYVGEIIYDG